MKESYPNTSFLPFLVETIVKSSSFVKSRFVTTLNTILASAKLIRFVFMLTKASRSLLKSKKKILTPCQLSDPKGRSCDNVLSSLVKVFVRQCRQISMFSQMAIYLFLQIAIAFKLTAVLF